MTFKMQTLYTNPISRIIVRLAKNCTVILSTGKKLEFMRASLCCGYVYEGSLTKQEQEESIYVLRLMGY